MTDFCVLLVEDNPTFRTQITGALARVADSGAVAGDLRISTASTGAEALDFVTRCGAQGKRRFDLALVDIGLPDISGIEVIRRIRSVMADTPILVISVINAEQTLLDAIRAGASGYLLKDEAEESIAHAIMDVMRGNYPISPALARSLFRLAGSPDRQQADTVSGGQDGVSQSGFHLAPREREVLQHIALGLSYQEVAEEMGVSLSTVQTYVRGLYRKLEVHNRVAAVNRAREAGML